MGFSVFPSRKLTKAIYDGDDSLSSHVAGNSQKKAVIIGWPIEMVALLGWPFLFLRFDPKTETLAHFRRPRPMHENDVVKPTFRRSGGIVR